MDVEGTVGNDQDVIILSVKHVHENLQVRLPAAATVMQLMLRLQELTNIVPRGQKLICKGKVLTGDMTLKNANVANGSKIMLMQLQGFQQKVQKVQKDTAALNELKRKASLKYSARAPTVSKGVETSRADNWKATGIVSWRDSELLTVPNEAWTVGESARIMDMCGNLLQEFPENVQSLPRLQKLRLSNNCLKDDKIHWRALTSLKHLTFLALDNNLLTKLPPELGQLSSMKELTVSSNALADLPKELGHLLHLERLALNKNSLTEIPSELGNCKQLQEIDLSDNYLKGLPASFSKLEKLKVLRVANNALSSFSSEILLGCVELNTLSLHGNEVTIESLRQVEGWPEFDERRKSKYSKQLDFNVIGSSSGFDEGADAQDWHHW